MRRRSASEIIRNLEMRIARLEGRKTASSRMSKDGEKIMGKVEGDLKSMIPDLTKRFEALESNPIVTDDVDVLNPMLGNLSGSAQHLSESSFLTDALKSLVQALELIHETEERTTELEKALEKKTKASGKKAGLSRNAGRRFDADEWIYNLYSERESEVLQHSYFMEADELQDEFESRVKQICDDNDLSICDDEGVSEVSYRVYSTDLEDMDHADASKLEKLAERDRKLDKISDEIWSLPSAMLEGKTSWWQ
jgi:hypothetical protein